MVVAAAEVGDTVVVVAVAAVEAVAMVAAVAEIADVVVVAATAPPDGMAMGALAATFVIRVTSSPVMSS